MTPTAINPDLRRERNGSNIRPKEIASYMYGEAKALLLQKLAKMVSTNNAFNTEDLWYMSRTQRYLRACERGLEFVKVVRENRLMEDEESVSALEMMAGEDFFVMLHLTMFLPTIENLADDYQRKHWLPLARDFRILGTYAQTELAHGSNVAGLQTVADLDLENDEWVINTPTLEAAKWWPGGLAKSCNYCVLMARLRISGQDYGVHAFVLPIRDPESHRSLPGVMLFDIGQKMGYNGMDNGGMQLHNVRIPRDYLLQKYVTKVTNMNAMEAVSRYVKVDRNGTYTKVGNEKMLYATMTYTRKQIILGAGPSLAKAATIAVRYSAVRLQFPKMDQQVTAISDLAKLPEGQVLDYSTQQYTLFPMIATAVGFIFAGRHVNELYVKMITAARDGDFTRLNEMHILTSALKASMTMIVIDGIEACRKAMGGHGYLLSAGVPLQYTSYVPQATYEGDFVVLSIQCGRGLLRMVQKRMAAEKMNASADSAQKYVVDFDPFADYVPPGEAEDIAFDDLSVLLQLFEHRACALIYSSAQRMAEHINSGLSTLAALDEEKIAFTRITKAHCHAVVLRAFKEYVDLAAINSKIYVVFRRLYTLYAAYWMEQDFSDFIAAKVVSIEHRTKLMKRIHSLLKELRPDAVAIVDGFGFPDFMLNSVLGRTDGNVYEALFDATKLEPLNQSDVTEGYYRYIQYILHPERKGHSPIASRL